MKIKGLILHTLIFVAVSFFNLNTLFSQMNPIGIYENHEDVGNPILAGSTIYDPVSQSYTLTGAGINLWYDKDQFQFAWKKIKGDFIVSATIQFIGEGSVAHRKIGIIAREKLTANAAYADACVHGSGLTSLQYRAEEGGKTSEVGLSIYGPTEIELQRIGNTFIFSAANFGEVYTSSSTELDLNEELFVGLFICSHAENTLEKAVFSNVRITIPADKNFVPYTDYIGSHLEVMDVATGLRKILYSDKGSIQAPNWTPDNKYLIYNKEGSLYKYSLADGSITQLNTGSAVQNNNDHVLSFDGKQMAISSHTGNDNISCIYTLPISGTDSVQQITQVASGHSFLHGWSPDGKKLIFTGNRNGQWDIWSVNVDTKEETQLTNNPTLDDGSEYSPDGKYIYFNSVRTGNMQIWRMKPDGIEQQQMTFDEYNNWFPHVSSDGKWIVYLAFPKEIDPNSHPFYKKVYLRLMPVEGGVVKTIAYLYGGQGTINVPSWSPDRKYIAFVSNTKL